MLILTVCIQSSTSEVLLVFLQPLFVNFKVTKICIYWDYRLSCNREAVQILLS